MDEGSAPRRLWARATLERWFSVLLVASLLVAAVGGVLTVNGQSEQTRTELRETASWDSVGEFDHSARVTRDTGPFETERVLRNRSIYFLRASPQFQGSFAYAYDASDGGDLRVRTTVVLVTRSVVEREEGNDTELWRTEQVLATDEAQGLSPGETVAVEFSRNVTAAAQRATQIDEQLGGTPGERELFVEARVDLSGSRNGESVDQSRTYRLPITLDQSVYRVDDPGEVTHGDVRQERVTVTVPSTPLEQIGGPALLVLGLGGVFALVLGRVMGDIAVDDRERAYLRYRSDRKEYDQWITRVGGGVPVGEDPASVERLQGLVDLAIDTDSRVIEDTEAEHYVVRHEGLCYVYEPPTVDDAIDDENDPPDGDDGDPEAAEAA